MTLTKEQLLEKAKPKFAWVEIEGFGKVGVRSWSQVQQSRRIALNTPENLPAYQLIDQLMQDEETPMFTEADLAALNESDSGQLAPLFTAIEAFNGNDPKKASGESTDT